MRSMPRPGRATPFPMTTTLLLRCRTCPGDNFVRAYVRTGAGGGACGRYRRAPGRRPRECRPGPPGGLAASFWFTDSGLRGKVVAGTREGCASR